MAKIKLGPNITEISGPIKNVSYGRYKRSKYFCKSRGCNISNPQSPRQDLLRRVAQQASSFWRDILTPQQRDNWEEHSKELPHPVVTPGGILSMIPQSRGIMSGYHAFFRALSLTHMSGIAVPPTFINSPLGQTPPSAVIGLSVSWEPDFIPNYALLLDGVDEYIDFHNVLSYEFNQPFSWEFFVNTFQPLTVDHMFNKLDAPQLDGIVAFISNKVIHFQIVRWSNFELLEVTRAFDVPDAYHQIIFTYDGSNNANGMRIYVDNVPGQVVVSNVPITASIQTASSLYWGGSPFAPGSFLQRGFDCSRNYNRVITPAEVNTVWNAGAGLYGADPFADASCQGAWMFCTGHNHILHDISGNGYDGDMINMEPADWVPGHVPCPTILAHVLIEWTDPIIVIPGSKVRVWIRSRELGVHKQLIANVDLDEEENLLRQVRMSQGILHTITDFPGHYLIQADVIQPNGLKSPPSHTVEVTVP